MKKSHLYEILDALKPIVESKLVHILQYCTGEEGRSEDFGVRRIYRNKQYSTDNVMWVINEDHMEVTCHVYPFKNHTGRRYTLGEQVGGSSKTIRIMHTDPDMLNKLVDIMEEFLLLLGTETNPW